MRGRHVAAACAAGTAGSLGMLWHIAYGVGVAEQVAGTRFPFLLFPRDTPRRHLPSINLWLLLQSEKKKQAELIRPAPRSAAIVDRAFLTRALNYLYFSESAYPKDFMLALNMDIVRIPSALVIDNEESDEEEAICERTGIKLKDLLYKRVCSTHLRRIVPYGGRVAQPSCFVARDADTLVVAIRGTASVSDAVTNCLAFTADFPEAGEGVEAHEGILLAARHVYSEVLPTLRQAIMDKPTTKIVTTGHSLGAGCATLLNILIAKDFPDIAVESFVFGGPPVLSKPMLAVNVNHFVLRNDIVPTLSVWNVLRFLDATKQIDRLELTTWQRLRVLAGIDKDVDIPTQSRDFATKPIPRMPQMHHVGKQIRIDKYDDGAYYTCRQIDAADVNERVSVAFRGSLIDHLPSRYETALGEVVRGFSDGSCPPS
eukprot:GEMP01044304.1.p1 GENE.GEMP01044304.1~~GEMP01044304.1.p1  ORF type:complete len:428 (+),score=88.32 GEMP01044304.1:148-1431(+)